eukprot:2238220-Pyramimonas_sp.AAC.1
MFDPQGDADGNADCLKEKHVFGSTAGSYLDVGRYPINYVLDRRLQWHPACSVAGLCTYPNATLSACVLGKMACSARFSGYGGDLMKARPRPYSPQGFASHLRRSVAGATVYFAQR